MGRSEAMGTAGLIALPFLLLGFSLVGYPGSFDGGLFALILSTYIGWILLSVPLLLPPLLQLPIRLYRTGLRRGFESSGRHRPSFDDKFRC